MGTYYRIANLDKEEIIDLSQYVNIKAGAYEHWSLQIAIMVLLIGGPNRTMNGLKRYERRWEGDRIRIEADYNDYEPYTGHWNDIGEKFIVELHERGDLKDWFKQFPDNTFYEYVSEQLCKNHKNVVNVFLEENSQLKTD